MKGTQERNCMMRCATQLPLLMEQGHLFRALRDLPNYQTDGKVHGRMMPLQAFIVAAHIHGRMLLTILNLPIAEGIGFLKMKQVFRHNLHLRHYPPSSIISFLILHFPTLSIIHGVITMHVWEMGTMTLITMPWLTGMEYQQV